MGIMPYGYAVEDGMVHIDGEPAAKVRKLFLLYAEGMSIEKAAREAGIDKTHSAVGNILSCRKYLGDGAFPQIVDEALFERVRLRRERRGRELGRDKVEKKEVSFRIGKRFAFNGVALETDDPLRRAQAIYETIVEV